MHIDINSCFATIEQQANPFLRNIPVAVAAYTTDRGCILAASYSAKYLGVKTGMYVKDAKLLCPNIIVLSPDPPKYRFVHRKLKKILESYSSSVIPKSIDEFVVNFEGLPILELKSMQTIALEIKNRIKKEIGEYITVSIGIAPNRFLAKTAASYKKPDGLFEINNKNYLKIFESLKLTDLCGIKKGNALRLSMVNIFTVMDFYNADIQKLKLGFHSINGYYWHMRLHGYETDDFEIIRKSFGNSYALPKQYSDPKNIAPILTKLIEKMSFRLRKRNYVASGIHLGILFKDYSYWHKGLKLTHSIFASSDFQKEIFKLLLSCPDSKPVKNLAVTCFNLQKKNSLQLNLIEDVLKKENLTKALDCLNNKYGEFTVIPARMMNNQNFVLDRIAFGVIDQ
ncbi:DNA polymerase IV [soil metagenome]